jgi:hypothetical protein
MKKLFLILAIFLVLANHAFADTHYVATTGTDSGTCGSGNACASLQYAFTQIASGDTLEIADGAYADTGSNGHDNFITNTYYPPSGPGTGSGDARFTIIKATNDLAVTIDLTGSGTGFWTRTTGEVDYVKFQGIIFKTDVSGMPLIDGGSYGGGMTNSDHIFWKTCGFAKINASSADNSTVWIDTSYWLFEDCFFWGSGKYLVHDRGSHNVWRRNVFRADNLNGGGQPCAPVMSYEATEVEWQNMIILDTDASAWVNCSYYLGGFATHHAADAAGTDNNYLRGSIVLNNSVPYVSGSVNTSYWIDGNTSQNNEFHDCVAIGGTGGFTAPAGYGNKAYNCMAINLADAAGTARGFNGFESIIDSISYSNEVGFYAGAGVTYSSSYGNGTDWSGTTHSSDIANDPTGQGLTYPLRIETGSTLATAGSAGGIVGASILYKIGTDGTFYEESGYATTTANSLWPYPNETAIRANMRTYSPGELSGERGFCADGKTLSNYIWEAMGGTCPSGMCGTDETAPTVTSVNSDKTNGSYTTGEVIDIDVVFSEAVTSTGNVTMTCETGDTDRTCTFTVTNASTGTCNYTVQAGDTSADLNCVVSGTIADAATNAMSVFTATTTLAANKAIVIDTTVPTVDAFTVPATSATRLVTSSTFTCTGATGYIMNESAEAPLPGAAGWTASAPTSYTFDSDGEKTLYGYCKDLAGNVSDGVSDTVTVTTSAISKAPFVIQ